MCSPNTDDRLTRRKITAFISFTLFFIVLLNLSPALSAAQGSQKPVRIGVLAYRGADEALKMWSPTAGYLKAAIPQYFFSIVPLDFREIGPAVAGGKVDFVLANTSLYVELEYLYGITRIATLKNRGSGGGYTVFGGVIVCRAERNDISGLNDLRGKSFMAVDETSFGGWQVAWRELKGSGINPYRDFTSLLFGRTHDAVVYAVRDGKVDAGTVRTDTLERMAEEQKIDLRDFRVLNHQHAEGFPFALSTRLYPEWPLAKTRQTGDELAQMVVIALLRMPPEDPAARAGKITGWTIPLDYQPVHELMRELRLGPYKEYGRVTLSQAVRQYWYWVFLALLVTTCMAAATGYVLWLNRRLVQAHRHLDEAHSGLERQIRERKFLQSVIDGVNEPIMVIGIDHHVQMMNRAATDQLLPDSPLPRPQTCYELSHHRDRPCDSADEPCPLREVVNTKQSIVVTHRHSGRDGREATYEILASPIFSETGEVTQVIETCRDITGQLMLEQARRRLDEQFYREQKEQTLITLASGIAHDFNNGLMGMLGNAELLKRKLSSDAPEQEMVDNIMVSGRHMAGLTRQLLAYVQSGRHEPEIFFLGGLIREALSQTRKGNARVEVVADIAEDLGPVFADAGQICQGLVNVLTNAFEALDKKGGRLVVHASKVQRDAWECPSLRHEHPQGTYVFIRISDNGPGIPAALHKKIFEPFFTTKFMGRGLGLASAAGIFQLHKGCISLESEPGKGASFQIYLPVAERSADAGVAQSNQEGKAPFLNKVLIVDDDPRIQSLVESILLQMGKDVRTAGNGAEAIEIFKQEKGAFGLAILDIGLPDMDGKKLFQELKALSPGLKVLISSGYDEKTALAGFGAVGPEGFIQKPYWINTLEEKVNKILHG
jgi:two-component system sensor histidine kinase TtrS